MNRSKCFVLGLLCAWAGLPAQELAVQGKVTDAAGKPMGGVLVRILASDLFDTTDAEGHYALSKPIISVARPGKPVPGRGGGSLLVSPHRGNLPGTSHDLSGRHLAGMPLSAGAFVRAPSIWNAPAAPATATPAATPTAKASAALPSAWIQAWKPGHAYSLRRLKSPAATEDFTLAPATGPDFGPNVIVFDSSWSMVDIQGVADTVFNRQVRAQFGLDRYAFVFRPGAYAVNVDVGYYTQVLGTGYFPGDVAITGSVRSQSGTGAGNTNVTVQFWRACENLSITPTTANKTLNWAVSQAAPFRRNHVKGSLNLSIGGWASGGYLADTRVDGNVTSGSQQQWFSRNTQWTAWQGGVWNMFFLGIANPPAGTWPTQPYTVIPQTPVIREKPFLLSLAGKDWGLRMPALRRNVQGLSWADNSLAGTTLPLSDFHLALPGIDNAASMNAALAQGKHLFLTPGIYHLEAAVKVTKPGTVVYSLGLATLVPDNGTAALEIADVDGVTVSGVVVDAGPVESPVLLRVGEPGSSADHSANPTVLHDVFLRVGGPRAGSAAVTVEVNSHHVIADHFWVWRADHGIGAKWDINKGRNGLVVRGDNVTAYGLFVEHYQEYQTLWEGEGGRTYFYQCELPYDPPSQDLWQHDGVKGWAGYKVGPDVKTHQAWGLGVYSAFKQLVVSDNAVEAPTAPGVDLSHIVAIWLNGMEGSGINSVLNGTGGAVTKTKTKATLD